MSNTDKQSNRQRGKHAAPQAPRTGDTRQTLRIPEVEPRAGERAPHREESARRASCGAGHSAYRPVSVGSPSPYAVEMEPVPSHDRGRGKRGGKIAAIVCGSVAGALLIAYLVGVAIFSGHFWPNAKMGDTDISFKTPEEIALALEQDVESYTLRVHGDGLDVTLSASDAGVDFNAERIVSDMFEAANAWAWPLEVFSEHDETDALVATLDESGVSDELHAAIDEVNSNAQAPVNATVAYDESTGMFEIVKERYGTQINADVVMEAMSQAVSTLRSEVSLDESALSQPTILSTDQRVIDAAANANGMILVNVQFALAGTIVASLDASVVAPCITIGDDLSVSLDEDALGDWADKIASTYSTVGNKRTYTRADGKQVSVSGGSYGWKIDRDALLDAAKAAIDSDQTGQADLPCSQTGTAAPSADGGRDWGARYIDVDLTAQHAWLFDESGAVVWESDIVSGKPTQTAGSLTPSGVYVINSNSGGSTLKGTNDDGTKYETPVTYWMPFVGNLIGFHDATWQSAFGGTRYKDGAGSHGCVNLPYDKAEALHSLCRAGDVVVCHW